MRCKHPLLVVLITILRSLNGVTDDEKMDVFEGCDQSHWHCGLEYTVVLNVCALDEMTAKGWYRVLGSALSVLGTRRGSRAGDTASPHPKSRVPALTQPCLPSVPRLLFSHPGPGFWGIDVCVGGCQLLCDAQQMSVNLWAPFSCCRGQEALGYIRKTVLGPQYF